MKRAAEKLKNARGASILLALLFVLVCMMIGASVLMAASTNAGRTRSNHEEQQFYLALSSAMQLVADDLTDAQYTANVVYTREKVTTKDMVDAGGYSLPNLVSITHTFSEGTSEMNASLEDVFKSYLKSIVDARIGQHLRSQYKEGTTTNTDGTLTVTYNINFPNDPAEQGYTLIVTPSAPLEGYEAEVEVAISTDCAISLTARLTKAPVGVKLDATATKYQLTTELTPVTPLSTLLTRLNGYNETTGDDGTTSSTIAIELTWNGSFIEGEYNA